MAAYHAANSSGYNPITHTYASKEEEEAVLAEEQRRLASRRLHAVVDHLDSRLVPNPDAEEVHFGRSSPIRDAAGQTLGPEIRSSAEVLAEQYEFNPILQRYRTDSVEAKVRQQEESLAAAKRGEYTEARRRTCRGHDIITGELIESAPQDILDREARDAAIRTRPTANHTRYSFDVLTGEPKAPNHDSIRPDIRAGRAQPADEPLQRIRSDAGTIRPLPRGYDILNGATVIPETDIRPARTGRKLLRSHPDHDQMLEWSDNQRKPPGPITDYRMY